MDLFNLTAKLTLDTSDYDKNIDKVNTNTSKFSSQTEKNISTIAKNAWLGIAGTVTKVAGTIAQATLDLVNYADKYGDLSAKYDISSQSLQEFEYVATQTGATLDGLLSTMTMMYNRAKEGDEVFAKLGVSVTDANGNMKSMDELFWEVKEALDGIENSGDKSALMLEAFGRNAMSAGEFLRTDASELKAMADEAHELGIVLDEEVVDKAGGINDKIDEFKLRWQSALSALLLGQENAMDLFENVLNDTIDYIANIDWIGLGLRIGKSLLKGILNAGWNTIATIFGKGWLWGKEDNSGNNIITTTTPDEDIITDTDIVDMNSYEINERSSKMMEIKLTASGTSAIDDKNIKAIAKEIVPIIDKELGGI